MPKVNKKTMIIIGAGVAAVLLLMYLRSRSASSSSSAPTDTMGTTDTGVGSGYADLGGQIQQGAANEASDIASLQGQFASLQGQESADIAGLSAELQAAQAPPTDTTGAPVSVAPGVNVPGTPSQGTRLSTLTGAQRALGYIAAPFGRTRPQGVPPGYHIKGTGRGNWALVPNAPDRTPHPKTGQPKRNPVAAHQNGNHPRGTAGHAVAPRSHAPARAQSPAGARLVNIHPALAQPSHPRPAPAKPSAPARKAAPPPRKPAKGKKR